MAINITTDQQNAKYAEELETDLNDYFRLLESEINDFLRDNENLTVAELVDYLDRIFDGNQELN